MDEKTLPFLKRFWIYQKERFPIVMNLIAVVVFTFSAISYSRICRGVDGFVAWETYLIGCFATFTLFFLVRVFDEFKDKEEDAKFRSYLPVPRGVMSLKELRNIGIIIGIVQIAVIAYFQLNMLYLYVIVLAYLCLMGVEFFVPTYLKPRQILYITSHMFIFPLLDIYSSGLDWLLEGSSPHFGLIFFFIVSYLNGLLVEVGRKLKATADEEEGVVSYTGMWGLKGAIMVWTGLLITTLTCAILAATFAGYGTAGCIILSSLALLAMIPAIYFVRNPNKKSAKMVEATSAIWTVGMYLSLGGIPMLMNLINA
ncbi:MAG: 4-hydroxybenzoate polyprenyltransferase [Flavobacteriaceae bacterium]|jgi:4-hydroxybenzoate polyprenyltransferase